MIENNFYNKAIKTVKWWQWIGLLFVIQWAIHLPFMQVPATGQHVWRQCNSLALARNFSEEGMNILEPKIDKRYNTPGVTGPSFPSYEYTLAVIYKLTGFSQTTHRWLSLFLSFVALASLFGIILCYTSNMRYAFWGGLALLSIPEFYFHSINALPDIMALAAMLAGWGLALLYFRKQNIFYLVGSFLFLAVAGMTKLQFLLALVPIVLFVFQKQKSQIKWQLLPLLILCILPFLAAFWWQMLAKDLTARYNLWEFLAVVRFPTSLADFLTIAYNNMLTDLPETWIGYGLILPFLFGCFALLQKNKALVLWSTMSGFAFYLALQKQFEVHDYYMLVFTPFIALAVAAGINSMAGLRQVIFIALLALSPAWAIVRESHNWKPKHYRVPFELVNPKNQSKIWALSNPNVRYIVGPDQSGCVYFYYLHAKGYPWYRPNDTGDFRRFLNEAAGGFITNTPEVLYQMNGINEMLVETGRVGGFVWFEIKRK